MGKSIRDCNSLVGVESEKLLEQVDSKGVEPVKNLLKGLILGLSVYFLLLEDLKVGGLAEGLEFFIIRVAYDFENHLHLLLLFTSWE